MNVPPPSASPMSSPGMRTERNCAPQQAGHLTAIGVEDALVELSAPATGGEVVEQILGDGHERLISRRVRLS